MSKTKLTLIALLISISAITQNGINYKALIKDANGNVLASAPINIQFIIYEGDALNNNVYQESHTINTDTNGFLIVDIGEGATSNDFNAINWGDDVHFLNVQINTGSGLVDLGTTQFMAVPYAKNAETASNVSGLEAINEGNGVGYRIIGRNADYYANIGFNAVDLSFSGTDILDFGATGEGAFASGIITRALGEYSTAMGGGTVASGTQSTALGGATLASGNFSIAMGNQSEASGYASTTMGIFTEAPSFAETAIGYSTKSYTPISTTEWNSNDRLFSIGNGSSFSDESNALTVLKNGNIGIGTENPQELLHLNGTLRLGDETIRDAGNDALLINAALIPEFDDTNVIGNSSQRWRTVYAVNGTINTSDRREKKNINTLNYGLAEVLQMQPVRFNWKNKNSPDTKLGLIAQDLQTLIPEVVKSHTWEKNESGQLTKKELERLGVYYSDLVPVLIKAIQEQQDLINTLNTTISKHKDTISNQEKASAVQAETLETLLNRVTALEHVINQ